MMLFTENVYQMECVVFNQQIIFRHLILNDNYNITFNIVI